MCTSRERKRDSACFRVLVWPNRSENASGGERVRTAARSKASDRKAGRRGERGSNVRKREGERVKRECYGRRESSKRA